MKITEMDSCIKIYCKIIVKSLSFFNVWDILLVRLTICYSCLCDEVTYASVAPDISGVILGCAVLPILCTMATDHFFSGSY